MKYASFAWQIAKYCDFFYFFVICVRFHTHINTQAVNIVKNGQNCPLYSQVVRTAREFPSECSISVVAELQKRLFTTGEWATPEVTDA